MTQARLGLLLKVPIERRIGHFRTKGEGVHELGSYSGTVGTIA